MALASIKSLVRKERKLFCLAASLPVRGIFDPPNKKFFLRVLGASAVKMLFWTGIIRFTEGIGYLSADRYEALWAKSQEGLRTLQRLISYVEKSGV